MSKQIKVALIGNPNTGKTSIFNQLTGLTQKVGNYPGITVDKKQGSCKLSDGTDVIITDLPGTYSINPTSLDESIVLEVEGCEKNILLIHGHQADFFNYVLWKWSRFLVRILWKPLQFVGIKDPTSPAKNFKELIKVESRLKKWILANNNQMVIAGHTHRPRFPEPNELPFFNDGSCVHPRSITGIEIVDMHISLIKWHIISREDGTLQIVKTVLEGPSAVELYLK